MPKQDRWEKALDNIILNVSVADQKKAVMRLINKALKTDPVCKNCGEHLKIHGFPDWRYRAKCDKFVLDRGQS